MRWDILLSSIDLGVVRARNRIVFRAHRTNLASHGRVSQSLISYYLARAHGGCGAIIVGELSLHPSDRPYEKMIEVYEDSNLVDLRNLTDPIREAGSLVFAELNHHGFQSDGKVSRLPLWGPSALADVVHGEVCQKMGPREIETATGAFAESAIRLKEAGFDGLEVSIGSGSLLRQFLSPLTNTRDDDYGRDLTGRLRLPLEVLTAVREAVGSSFTMGVRLCVDEMFYGALTEEESLPAAREIENRGLADYFSASVSTYYNLHLARASMHHPVGLNLEKAAALKSTVNVPVAAGNRIKGPHMAEEALKDGKVDLIAWNRPLICDPELPNKLMGGRENEIIGCVYDNQDCVGRTERDRTIGCIQNVGAGRESEQEFATRKSAPNPKRVLIVGAGPAGLESACTSASRGHDVTLYEKAGQPGGQVLLAQKQPGREELEEVVKTLAARLERLSVPVNYGWEMDAASILAEAPDVVIVATGSYPKPNPVPGDYGPPEVLNVWQVLEQTYPIGERVLLIDEDGHHKASGTAIMLADQGHAVDMVTSESFVGVDLAAIGDLYDTRQRLITRGVRFHCNQVVTGIFNGTVKTFDKFTGEPGTFEGYDSIVQIMGQVSDDSLYKSLMGQGLSVYRAGDCVAPRRIDSAIREGHRIAARI